MKTAARFIAAPVHLRNAQFFLSREAARTLETAMPSTLSEKPRTPRQAVRSRFFWFLAGSGLNYLLIATPLKWLDRNTELPIWVIAPLSMAVSASFFFAWNYFVNFRTHRRKREALPRYIGAVLCMWMLSSATLTALKHFDANMAFNLGRFPLDLDIVATQFFLSGLKFFLYHKWVFPLPAAGSTPAKAGET